MLLALVGGVALARRLRWYEAPLSG
jgi:hypothetical protein